MGDRDGLCKTKEEMFETIRKNVMEMLTKRRVKASSVTVWEDRKNWTFTMEYTSPVRRRNDRVPSWAMIEYDCRTIIVCSTTGDPEAFVESHKPNLDGMIAEASRNGVPLWITMILPSVSQAQYAWRTDMLTAHATLVNLTLMECVSFMMNITQYRLMPRYRVITSNTERERLMKRYNVELGTEYDVIPNIPWTDVMACYLQLVRGDLVQVEELYDGVMDITGYVICT